MNYLNTENIARSGEVEWHPLRPCIDEETRVLFLGSFPPQRKRWAKGFDFFYPNFINDHWRIMGLILLGDKDALIDSEAKTYRQEAVLSLVKQAHLGYYDTSEAVRRLKDNASDKFLEVVVQTDIRALVSRAPRLRTIVVTGQKAADTLCDYFDMEPPKMGESTAIPYIYNSLSEQIRLCRLPSSSRAYPMALDKKATYYRQALTEAGILKAAKPQASRTVAALSPAGRCAHSGGESGAAKPS